MLGRAAISMFCLVTLVAGCAAEDASARPDPPPRPAPTEPRPTPDVIAAALDSLASRVVAESLTPALGVALVMDGKTILARSYGMADASNRIHADDSTLWYVASSSKSYTGFGTALLAHEGVVDFAAPITTLLPHAQWPAGFDAASRTLADFLAHTHGLGDNAIVMTAAFTGAFPEAEWPAMLRHATPLDSRAISYSNLGYNVAGMVIDAKRPEGWRRYLDSAVYKPAGMTQTYARVSGLDEQRFAKPHELLGDGRYATRRFQKTDATMNTAGGHLATMHDLARWVTVQMDSGVIDGKRVFPAEAVVLSHRMIATHAEKRNFAFFDREGWAAGWDIGAYEGEPMVSRFGAYSSLRSHLSFLPRRRIGVVAQSNGDLGWDAVDILAAFAYDLEAGRSDARAVAEARMKELVAQRPAAVEAAGERAAGSTSRKRPLERPLSDFAGDYHHEAYGTVAFDVRGDTVHYTWGVLGGVARIVDARTCSWRGCRNYHALLINVGDVETAVEFGFPRTGPAHSLRLRGESFKRR